MTQLQDGRLSMIVDPGAWSNLIGAKLASALVSRAITHKEALEPKRVNQLKLQKPLEVAGVGKGSQRCEYEMLCPIALTDDH